MTTVPRLRPRLLVLIALVALAAAACTGSSGAASSDPSGVASEPPHDLPTTVEPGGSGGGSSGSAGSGTVVNPPGQIDPVGPAPGQAKLVRPSPGQKDLRPVAPTKLEASVDGRHVLVKVSWYSGVEPCNVLDSVKIERAGSDIAITPVEGTGPGDAICIEIAELKATIVDLGDLDAGSYRILAPTGDAPALEITIS
jgi:hypothetical protein